MRRAESSNARMQQEQHGSNGALLLPELPVLVAASRDGALGALQAALAAGADPNSAGSCGRPAVWWAAANGRTECLVSVLAVGASPHAAAAETGETALHAAARWGHVECLEALLRAGASPHAADLSGETPLFHAARSGHAGCVAALLRAGARPAAVSHSGDTALHSATAGGSADCAAMLLAAGARAGAAGSSGWTPLHMCARRGHDECSTALLLGGASADAVDADGHTPGQLDAAGVINRLRDVVKRRPRPPPASPLDHVESQAAGLVAEVLAILDASGDVTDPGHPGTPEPCRDPGALPLPRELRPLQLRPADLVTLRPLSSGSYGDVKLCTWHETTPVAVKVLKHPGESGRNSPSELLAAMHAEASLQAQLRHPNVVLLLGVVVSPPSLVFEYCQLGDLLGILKQARSSPQRAAQLTWLRRLRMARGAAAGMLYLHKNNVVHLDLKSDNLVVTAAWTIKVTDFNLSRSLSSGDSVKAGTAGGHNPRWQAPEVLSGDPASSSSDVFSFGVVLWELLTWEMPFSGVDTWTVMQRVVAGKRPPVPPREQLPGPDTQQESTQFGELEAYQALMRDCWAHDPGERPDFEAIFKRLGRMLQSTARDTLGQC